MASVIKAGNATDGVQVTSDNTGILELKTGTGSGTTAVTIGTDQSATFAGAITASGNQTVTGNLTVNGNTTLGDSSSDTILMTAAPSIGGAGLGMGFGFRNRIINGAMVIDQRNAGASVSIPSAAPKYSVDRFYADNSSGGGAVYSVQQVSDAPSGFNYSLKATVTTAAIVASGDYQYIRTTIEGFNFADMQFGTANAQTFTLSFWVKSSLTGTFGGYFGAALNARFRTFSYTINSANTWEYKTVVITGDTSGTWVGATNGVGLQVAWSLACGSSYLGATGSWSSSLLLGATGQTNLTPTNGATWFVTGVQLEKGSTATSFDYRPYGTELQLCQRYYYKNTQLGLFSSRALSTPNSNCGLMTYWPVTMRAAPTVVETGSGSISSLAVGGITVDGAYWTGTASSAVTTANITGYTASIEL